MSSSTFSTELIPDPAMRRLIIVAALAMTLPGLLVILSLPISNFLRAAAGLICTLVTGVELALISSAHKQYTCIRIYSDGAVEIRDRDGVWQIATIASGSIVLQKLAWFRLKPANGGRYYELVRGNSRESKQWRRLQVIWRHLGPAS